MSACARIAERLDGYADGELGLLGRWRVGRHVAGCSDCQRQLEALGRTGEWVRQAAVAQRSEPDFWPDIAPRLPSLDAARRARSANAAQRGGFAPGLFRPVFGGVLAAAAAAALLWVAVPTSEPATSGVVRALYSQGRSVVVLEEEGVDTIIWVMDERGGAERSGTEDDHARV